MERGPSARAMFFFSFMVFIDSIELHPADCLVLSFLHPTLALRYSTCVEKAVRVPSI
jgi:hypothetical protein